MDAWHTGRSAGTRWAPPRFAIGDGTLEALKWLALVLMTLDHINKYLLHGQVPALFSAGRLALPLFATVLGINLARPGRGPDAAMRIGRRLAICGTAASVPFMALGGLAGGWWPLNVAFTFLVAVAIVGLVDAGGLMRHLLAIGLFIMGGSLVEFWWPAISIVLAARAHARRPGWMPLLVWIACIATLQVINGNAWALASIPLIGASTLLRLEVRRRPLAFYAYYPAHLTVIALHSYRYA